MCVCVCVCVCVCECVCECVCVCVCVHTHASLSHGKLGHAIARSMRNTAHSALMQILRGNTNTKGIIGGTILVVAHPSQS